MNFEKKYLMVAAVLAGCSHGGSNNSDPNVPVGDVNSKISASGASALTGQAAMFEAGMGKSQSAGQAGLVAALTSRATAASTGSVGQNGSAKQRVQSKTNLLNSVIQSGKCEIDFNPGATNADPNSPAGQFPPTQIKISGASCPVEIALKLTMTAADGQQQCGAPPQQGAPGTPPSTGTPVPIDPINCKMTADMTMKYQVIDPGLQQLMEVTSGTVHMSIDMTENMAAPTSSDATVATELDMVAASKFEFKAVDLQGKAHLIAGSQAGSVKQVFAQPNMPGMMPPSQPPLPPMGTSGMQMQQAPPSMSMPQMFGSMKEDMQYNQPDTGVTSTMAGKVTFNGPAAPLEVYLVDGVVVTKEAYQAERDKFSISMMDFAHKN